MGIREVIGTLAATAALMPTSNPVSVSRKRRRLTEHNHFTSKQWAKRKSRMKMQKKSRQMNRQKA